MADAPDDDLHLNHPFAGSRIPRDLLWQRCLTHDNAKDLLEYVIVHEMVHLIEPSNDHFLTILGEQYPTWREAGAELNDLPLTAEMWNE